MTLEDKFSDSSTEELLAEVARRTAKAQPVRLSLLELNGRQWIEVNLMAMTGRTRELDNALVVAEDGKLVLKRNNYVQP